MKIKFKKKKKTRPKTLENKPKVLENDIMVKDEDVSPIHPPPPYRH